MNKIIKICNTYRFSDFLTNKWFEHGVQHIENIWLVNDMDAFQSNRGTFL